ncbi:ABC transporter substrate-binding protein [Saxibacter everestensis]|uniref:ABC transporter substrate-binding protein n=1 Tax=Saxibacter everestensis TaxID=2909229 RepID=A0ABY8QSU5_9MICO|nr:ABC transporter substrate-binding protein [Brevibacteriaceae bacterium ZFBP1038]
MRKLNGLAVIAIGALTLSACGGGDPMSGETGDAGSGGSGETIVVGSAAFPENALLAEIYAGALKSAGVDVSTKLNIGSRETYIPGLEDGSIDLIPEYTGNLLQYLDKEATTTDPAEVEKALESAMPEGLTVLEASEASDQDSVTVTKETADKYSLATISDLKPVAKDLVLGGPPEWTKRPTGVPGLEKTYGLKFKEFKPLDVAGPVTVKSLMNGQVQAANLFTTDPAVAKNGFVVLEDDKNLFLPGNVVPFINEEKASDSVTEALNKVSAAMTTDDLLKLVQRVSEKEEPADVAADWLKQEGLS